MRAISDNPSAVRVRLWSRSYVPIPHGRAVGLAVGQCLEAGAVRVLLDDPVVVVTAASEVSDTAANAVLAERPTTLPHLFLQMQIVMAEIVTHDLTTHAKRGRWLGDLPVTVEELRQDDRGLETRGWALIAENAARLDQLDLSSGWRALMADEGGIVKLHRNARDVLALAASKDIDPARFSGIHLTGRDDDKLPQMTFRTDDGHAIAMPGVVYDWKPVQ